MQGFYISKIVANSIYEKDDVSIVCVTFKGLYSLYSHHLYEEKFQVMATLHKEYK